jgi:magnesium-transporting ATPase (P-type)
MIEYYLGLTIVAKQMYRQRVLVKSLQIVETFNSVSLIATDKTGTLTRNKMTVAHVLWDINGVYNVPVTRATSTEVDTFFQKIRRLSAGVIDKARRLSTGTVSIARRISSGYVQQSERMPEADSNNDDDKTKKITSTKASEINIQAFRDLLIGASLCNNAEKQMIHKTNIEQDYSRMSTELHVVGDAVDIALYHLCTDGCHVDIERVRTVNPRLKVLPFNSLNKFMISAHQLETLDSSIPQNDRLVLIIVKGAPDIIIRRCSTYKTDSDEIVMLDDDMRKNLSARQEHLGRQFNRTDSTKHVRENNCVFNSNRLFSR